MTRFLDVLGNDGHMRRGEGEMMSRKRVLNGVRIYSSVLMPLVHKVWYVL